MDHATRMADIIVRHASEKVRYVVRGVPETGERDLLHVRDDIAWGDAERALVDHEVEEMATKEAYAELMDEPEVTQSIKVADSSVLFTGYIEDEVVVVLFERGILGHLPDIVDEFHEFMVKHDIDFTRLSMPTGE